MLKPAILYKQEIESLFAERIYTTDFYYYNGYPFWFEFPEIKPKENRFDWASIIDGKVVGYLSYRIDPYTDNVYDIGLISFDKGNIKFVKEVYNQITKLVTIHHRVEWKAIEGNPAIRGYSKFCRKHNGRILRLHDVTKDMNGEYKDTYIFEVLNNQCVMK